MKVSAICEDKLSNIWIGTRNGLNRFNGQKFECFYKEDGLCSNRILAINIRENNELIILTSEGLSFYDGQSFRNFYYSFPKVDYRLIVKDDIIYISDKTTYLQFNDAVFESIDQPELLNLKFVPGKVRIEQDSIFALIGNDERYLVDSHVNLIQSPSFWLTDHQDNVWIGSDNGLHYFGINYFQHIDEKTLPNIWAMSENDHAYLFASYGSGLFRMDKQTNEISNFNLEDHDKYFFQGVAEDKKGNLYFSNSKTLVKYDGEGLSHIFDWNPSFAATYDSVRNSVVFGTYNGIMILQKDGQLDSIINTNLIHPNNYIMNISIDKLGHYWLGSYKGLTRLNPDEFTSDIFDLPIGNGVFASCVDAYGNIWLGGERGLMLYDDNINSLKIVDSQLLNTQIKAIKEWDSHLIINTIDQVILFDHGHYLKSKEVITKFISNSISYPGFEPGLDGLYLDRNKEVWIMSGSSLDKLKVKAVDIVNNSLHVKIKQVDTVSVRNLSSDILSYDTIYLKDSKNINVFVEAIGMTRPHKLFYRYQINNDNWSKWSTNDTYVLKNLRHGTHKIKVELGPTDVVPNLQSDVLYININLPIHQRFFFVPLMFGLLIFSLMTLAYLIWRNYAEKKKYRYQLEEARYLRSQLLLSEMNPHFIFNVLASIQNKILIGDKVSANNNLIELSKLMRNFLSSSYKSNQRNKGFENEITLSKEMDMLKSYIEFEKSISNDYFKYSIIYEGDESQEQIMIPPMLIQPYVENAIKHGLLPKDKSGELHINFRLVTDGLICSVKDNGVGMDLNKTLDNPLKKHVSLGSKLVNERVGILNTMGYNIQIKTQSTKGIGTEVIIKIIDKF